MSDENELVPHEPTPLEEALADLNEKERLWVEEYVTGERSGKLFNATRSAEVAGYSDHKYGAQLKRRPKIKRAVELLSKELTMGPGEVLRRMTEVAESRPGDIIKQGVNGGLVIDTDKVIEMKHLIKSFSFDANGNPKIEFYDVQRAREMLGKAQGLFKEGIDIGLSGQVGVDVQINFVHTRAETPSAEEQPRALESGEG